MAVRTESPPQNLLSGPRLSLCAGRRLPHAPGQRHRLARQVQPTAQSAPHQRPRIPAHNGLHALFQWCGQCQHLQAAGHAQVSTTANIYAHVMEHADQKNAGHPGECVLSQRSKKSRLTRLFSPLLPPLIFVELSAPGPAHKEKHPSAFLYANGCFCGCGGWI